MENSPDLDCFTPDAAQKKMCAADPEMFCAGDACMAWRWSQAEMSKAFSKRVLEVAKADGTDWGKAHQKVLKTEKDNFVRKEGYCGLAGYPHNSLRP